MIENIIPLIIGLVFLFIAIKTLRKHNKLKKTGITTEGVVYDVLKEADSSFNFSYPIIRFTTLTQEWITETANIGTLPGFYKKGQKVTVIYDQNSPKEFTLDSKTIRFILLLFLIIGLLTTTLGVYLLIRVKL
ncbi:DUF3592 domain-containing protein [Terrimonas sp. NA20]|uniref:DUF3592 domain-containing protein n=1 Tax=Terrimonas ginsenosidimutans TaxID=2908004 RepID=A0ABS9L0W7_9BACT|nr:DUF3592 domain-containing protein [Terrimonas ginsenosidimutans]MCG2618195.1 DUF3592 domain-containing protein [Terrimonas ginsenosidimutans]